MNHIFQIFYDDNKKIKAHYSISGEKWRTAQNYLLVDKNEEMFKKMFEFNRSINLPTCLADIEMNEDDLDKLVPMVCNMKDIDHNPYKISEDMVYKAFKKLEEYSKIN